MNESYLVGDKNTSFMMKQAFFRNGRVVCNSIVEKTVHGNSIDVKQFDDNAPHLSR